jgi:hypothetical protein
MAVPQDAPAVVSALRLGWCMAEVRGRNRPHAPPGAGAELPSRRGHALPLQTERTPAELRIQAQALLIVLAAKLRVDGDGITQPSYARTLDSDAQSLAEAPKGRDSAVTTRWNALAELIYKFDAHIQDTLAARSDSQACGYQLGRAMAEAYWALDPWLPAGTDSSAAWWFLLGGERCAEIGRLAGRLSRYFHPYTAAAIAGSAMVWKNVAADPKWREDAAPALYLQIRRWYELTISAEDPTTLIGPYALLRNFRLVAHVLRAFWIQFLLTGLGAAALIAFADLLASPRGSSLAKSLLAAAGITGFSVAGVSGKLKNQAQAMLLRLRQDAYTDLIAVDITTAPPQPRAVPVLPARRRAKLAKMARQRSLTPVTPN